MTEIAYVGFDCSSKAIHGVVMDSDFNIKFQKKWSSKVKTFEERFPEITMSFWKDMSKIFIGDSGKEKVVVAIEQAIFIQNPKTTVEIANVIGCVRMACYMRSFDVVMVDNRKWKKEILGRGNAKKQEIMEYAVERLGKVFSERDFADAACIAAWAVKERVNG